MKDIIEAMFAVADWFVMEGAELRYSEDVDPYESGPRQSYLHEARFDDLQVFIGEPVTMCGRDPVAEVAVTLRTGIPLPVDVVDQSVEPLRASAPAGVAVEVIEGCEPDAGTTVWAVAFLDKADMDDGSYATTMSNLLGFARSRQAQAI